MSVLAKTYTVRINKQYEVDIEMEARLELGSENGGPPVAEVIVEPISVTVLDMSDFVDDGDVKVEDFETIEEAIRFLADRGIKPEDIRSKFTVSNTASA